MYAGWDGKEKTEEVRRALSRIKTTLEEFDGSPSNEVISTIQELKEMHVKNYVFFVNIREAKRIDEFKEKVKNKLGLSCHTLFVSNPNKKIIKSNTADYHAKDYNYDYYISNDGSLEELKEKAYSYLKSILKEI